ncbi:MAG: hypothetical protein ABFR62_13670 [Bacteroidota bacterium]
MKNFILAFLIIIPFLVSAQKQVDAVYMKNGSIIKGNIISQDESTIKVETLCGNIFVYNIEEVDETKRENYTPFGNQKDKGYYNYTSMGMLIGSSSDEQTSVFSILMEHNYQFNKNIAAGAVTGIEWFNTSMLPVGANLKLIYPTNNNMSLYLGASGGYSFPLEDLKLDQFVVKETKGGWFGSSEVGVVFPSSGNANLFVALGYRYQDMSFVREEWWTEDVERKITYNRLSLKVGISIH